MPRRAAGLFPGRVVVGCLFFIGLPLPADITGSVVIHGPPNSQDESFFARSKGCGESPIRHTENWKIGPKGELADVVVWLVDPKFVPGKITAAERQIQIKQIGCRYDPHVSAVRAAQPFAIVNGDPTLHNIRARVYDGPGQPPGADVFNFGQSYQGQKDQQQFDQPGIYTLQCDVHAWMQCWVRVLANDYFAVTGASGAFVIPTNQPLLEGDYKIDAWHPRFGETVEQIIHIKNGAATATFQFDGAKSF